MKGVLWLWDGKNVLALRMERSRERDSIFSHMVTKRELDGRS